MGLGSVEPVHLTLPSLPQGRSRADVRWCCARGGERVHGRGTVHGAVVALDLLLLAQFGGG